MSNHRTGLLTVTAVAGHDADARRVLRIPGVRQLVGRPLVAVEHRRDRPGHPHPPDDGFGHQPGRVPHPPRHLFRQHLHRVECHRQVVEHYIFVGQREVVHHRRPRDLDVDRATGVAVRVDHRVLHGSTARKRVGHRVQFAGVRVAMRMSGIAAGEGPVEIARADGVEFVGELVVGDTAFDQGQRLAGVGQHVGVGAQRLHSGSQVAGGRRRLARARSAHAALRTQRLRYQPALPSCSATPCTMPSPVNQ